MKVLLINPPYTNFEGMKESGGHMMPLNLAYLAAYLREKVKCKIVILDAEVKGLNYEQVKSCLKKEKADIIGLTCPTPTMSHVFRILKIVKTEIDSKCITVVGGIHPTVMPVETIQNSDVDFLVAGEGEITFFELVNAIMDKKKDFSHIDGLYFKKNGKVIANKPRQFIQDLDLIPFPARDLFDLKIYAQAVTKKMSDERAGPILTARGCAFHCTHCISQKMWSRRVRFRSAQNILKEIEECINKYGIKEINFFDDTFTLDQKRAMEICQMIIDKKLGIHWNALSRVNTMSKELAFKMKEAGCGKIQFGIESGSQKILNLMNKQATLAMARKAAKIVDQAGISAIASFMLGNVGETEKTIKQTVDFAKELPLDNATFFITSPYPGTEIYDIAEKEGFITKETKWEEFAPLTNTPPILIQKNVSKERLVYWQKRAFREFYIRPKYIFQKMRRIKSVGSIEMVLEGLRILFRILFKKS